MSGFRTILHATDFSDSSEQARRLAIALARAYRAKLVVLHAYPRPLNGAEMVDLERPGGVEDVVLERLREFVPFEKGLEIEYRAVEGDPAEMILREAACGCDLVVMGTHGRGGLTRALLGSVAERVSRGAPCPVATVRPSAAVPRAAAPGRVGEACPVGPVSDDPYAEIECGDPRRAGRQSDVTDSQLLGGNTVSAKGLAALDSTIQTTHVWLNEVCEEAGWDRNPHRAYTALRVVLHALRDRLHPNEVAGLAAQFPLLVRGIFYEGWHPAGKPARVRTTDEFLAPVADALGDDPHARPADAARAVFAVVKRHVSAGEVADVIAALPADIQTLWA